MMRRPCAVLLCLALLGTTAWGEQVPDGRALYQGHHPFVSGRAATANRLPPADAACAACHSALAEGRREGTTAAPPLAISVLLAPRAGEPAYASLAALRDAVRSGLGRNGRPLGPAMPRYRVEDAELDALLAYLGRVGTTEDRPPGVTADHIALGTVLPLSGPAASAGRGVLRGLEAALDTEVHGRRLTVVAEDGAAQGAPAALHRLFTVPVYAVVGGLWPAEAETESLLAGARVSHIGSLVQRRAEAETGPWSADLLAPFAAQQMVLSQAMARCEAGLPRLALRIAGGPDAGATQWFTDTADLRTALRGAGEAGCLGTSLAGAALLAREWPVGWQWSVVLPFPPALLEAGRNGQGPDPWQQLGFAAGRLAVEWLARAGTVLHERSLLSQMAVGPAVTPLPGAPLRFGARRRGGWDPGLMELGAGSREGG